MLDSNNLKNIKIERKNIFNPDPPGHPHQKTKQNKLTHVLHT